MPEPRQPYRAGNQRPDWDADGVQSLRRHLGLTQRALADELGVRQQTISEWETGSYRPRGAARRLLGLVAERAGFVYGGAEGRQPLAGDGERTDDDADAPRGPADGAA